MQALEKFAQVFYALALSTNYPYEGNVLPLAKKAFEKLQKTYPKYFRGFKGVGGVDVGRSDMNCNILIQVDVDGSTYGYVQFDPEKVKREQTLAAEINKELLSSFPGFQCNIKISYFPV